MRRFIYSISTVAIFCHASAAASISSSEETLAMRRIAAMWEKRTDPSIRPSIQREINNFLESHPKTPHFASLQFMQGDLYLFEKEYEKALALYTQFSSTENTIDLSIRRLHCYVQMTQWEQVSEEIKNIEQRLPSLIEKISKGEKEALGELIAETLCQLAEQQTDASERLLTFKRAQLYLNALSIQNFKENKLLRRASISQEIYDFDTAISCYLQLADRVPERKALYTIQAARIKGVKNPKEALQILSQLNHLPDEETVLLKASLLYKAEEDTVLLEEAPDLLPHLSSEKQIKLKLLCAQSASRKGDRTATAEIFYELLDDLSTLSSENRVIVILSAIDNFNKLNMLQGVKKASQIFFVDFPHHPKVAQVKMHLAKQLYQSDCFEEAESIIDELLATSLSRELKEEVELIKVECCLALERLEEVQERLSSYLTSYPRAKQRRHALFLAVATAQKQLEKNPVPESPRNIAVLQETLLQACHDPEAPLKKEEQTTLVYHTAYQLYEKERFRAADALLDKPPCTFSDNTARSRWLLLQAACDANGFEDWEGFILHANEAIQLDLGQQQSAQLRSALCQAKRHLAQIEKDQEKKEALLTEAENDLAEVVKTDRSWIDSECLLWYAKRKAARWNIPITPIGNLPSNFQKEQLFTISQLIDQAIENAETPSESTEEAWVLSALFSHWNKQRVDRDSKLKTLFKAYTNSPTKWQHKSTASYLLAITHLEKGEKPQALDLFSITARQNLADPAIRCAAQLQTARIRYAMLSSEQRTADAPEVVALLATIDQLANNRKGSTEPAHLEAAIESAHLRASLKSKKEQTEALYQALLSAKEQIVGSRTLIDKEYHAQREINPSQEKLFQGYLIFIDALAAVKKAQIAKEKGENHQALSAAKTATNLYSVIKENGLDTTPYLHYHCTKGVERSKELVQRCSSKREISRR